MRTNKEIHSLLENPNVISIKVSPEEYLNLFYDIYFLRYSWNTGMIYGKLIECPELTMEDVKIWLERNLKNLKEIVREWF